MIQLTRINHAALVLNCDLIEYVEGTPDTVISLVTGQKLRVLETPDEVIDKIIHFRRRLCDGRPPCAPFLPTAIRGPDDDDSEEGDDEATSQS